MAAKTNVELGFIEDADARKLHSCYFPSKIGGQPAWLILDNLPSASALQCKKCGEPCVFLLQVYAPLESKDLCFHRTIFVFVCKNPKCCSKNDATNFIALRGQLPRENAYYEKEPPKEDAYLHAKKAEDYQSMCVVCGCAGAKKCGRCHSITYCSRSHQTIDWKGGHKLVCSSDSEKNTVESPQPHAKSSHLLFAEFELVTEPEEYADGGQNRGEDEKWKEYEDYLKSDEAKSSMNNKDLHSDLALMAKEETESDKVFLKFKKRIEREPEQVLRYQKHGQPLWVSHEGQLDDSQIPKCECGAERKFEFQIMPQLLNHLKVDELGDSLDWGTVAIYTCDESCDVVGYAQEFVCKQDFSD